MNIAIVGGGNRCTRLLEFMEEYNFHELNPKVVALVDEREDAPCMPGAKKKGIFVSDDYNDLFARDDIDLIIEMTGKDDVFYDILRKKKSGVRIIHHLTAQLFWEVSRLSGIERRIQRQTERELSKTRTTFSVIMNELIQENVMIIGPNYEILDANETLLERMGFTREETIGRPCFEISHGQTTPCAGELHPCPLRDTLRTRKSSQTTHVHLDKDKKAIFYSISCYPIYENDEITAVVEISKDITKDINIQKALMQQQKLASIGRLAAGVAHEINNPMTTILTTAMLLQEDFNQDDPTYRELKTISDETLRCRKIVSSLLDFARQNKPVKKPWDINKIVVDSITLTRKQAAFGNITIISNLSEDLPLINVDKDQIQQALINLSLNAIEAIKNGGKITFTTRLSSLGDVIEILVSDTGEGIPEKNLNTIFEPFFTTKETGTGLGMAITYGLIEQHGGTIVAESKLGEGSTFTIRLPINREGHNAD